MSKSRADDPLVASGWRTNSVGRSAVREVQHAGRTYLQFPLVPLTEMVLNYPENGAKELLPAESIRETADLWDGTLLAYVHPQNRSQTVRDPDAFMGDVIGAFHNPRLIDGGSKLKGDGLLDVAKAKEIGGTAAELVDLLQRGEEVSVSAAYSTAEDDHQSGRFEGEKYDLVQGPLIPDHIAIFPSSSEMRARCSPEDGCAAPRANALQDGQADNQRATNGVRANMSDSESASNGGSVFPSAAERDEAIRAIQRENPNVGPGIKNNDDQTILTIAQGTADYQLPGCDCGGEGTCDCQRTNARRRSASRSRSSRRANMAAVPGNVSRDVGRERTRENADEYPSGGRSNWEARKAGVADREDDESIPTGSRSSFESRKARRRSNSTADERSDDESIPTGSRSSFERRRANAQSDADEAEWRDHDYPLTAKRKAEEEREKRRRWNYLREQAKRNDTNTTASRHSDES